MTYQKNQDNIAIIQLKLKDQNPDFLIQGYNEGLLENIIRLENDPDLKGVIIRFSKILIYLNMTSKNFLR